jgi:hypothetical protein
MRTQHEPGVAKDECEIYALLGREILGWGKVEPDISQFAVFYRPQGGGFVEQCPWADLGVDRLQATEPDLDNMRFFTAPKYSGDGKAATVSFVTKLVGRNPDGSARPPFISEEELSLAKIEGHWRLVGRTPGERRAASPDAHIKRLSARFGVSPPSSSDSTYLPLLQPVQKSADEDYGSSKLNAAESLMQEAPAWKAALCMAWSLTPLRVP